MERSWTLVSWWALLSLIGSAGCDSGGGSGPGNGTEDLSDRRVGDNRSGIDLQGYAAFGTVSGSGDAVTLPGGPTLSVSGGLKEPVTLALRPAAEEPSLDSGAIAVSDWYDAAADVNDLATGPDAPIRLSVPADPPPEAIGHPGLQLWAVLPGGDEVPLDGAFDPGTGRFTATLLGLPPSFTFAVVFREAVRRMDATEALEGGPLQSALMPDPPVGGWPATQWTLDFDGQRVTVAQAKKVLRAAMKAAAAYSSAGLKEPFLYLETTVLGPRWHIHLTAGGSSFDGNTRPAAADPAEHFGRLFVSTKRIDAASTDDLGSVLASIAHEMFHAIFRNYDIPYRCFDYEDAGRKWCYKSHTGFNEGMATAAGYFLDQGQARPRPTEDPKPLWEPVGWFDPEDRGLAYRNQDLFVYVLRIGTLNNLAAMLWSLVRPGAPAGGLVGLRPPQPPALPLASLESPNSLGLPLVHHFRGLYSRLSDVPQARPPLHCLQRAGAPLPLSPADDPGPRSARPSCPSLYPRTSSLRAITSSACPRKPGAGYVRFAEWLRRKGVLHKDIVAVYLRQRDRMDEPLPWRTRNGSRELGRGKAQLRNLREVEAYLAVGLALTHPDTAPKKFREQIGAERRVASALPLLCGLASGEVLHLKGGDIDLAAGIGYVRDQGADEVDGWHVKTAARNGEWEIPQVLRADLAWLTADRKPEEFLLRDREGRPHTRGWLRDLVVEVCGKSDVVGQPVRKVCPHGLRGTHATLLRVLLGRGIGDIANALRHGDEGRTATRHYVGAPERRPALRVLIGGMDEGEADGISSGISSGGRG
ncbi:hypothetical protein KBD49_06190 [Myxococcota bacterium]|nr:hypothetical protein [Myxococcota bacterium]